MTKVLRPIAVSLSETPSDVKPYYLKVTTHDNKVTKLAVDKIEEVTVDGGTLYKVTAKALISFNGLRTTSSVEDYVHYIAKPKAHEVGCLLQFQRTCKAMQANPTGTFKLGSNMNATNVQPAGKSLCNQCLQREFWKVRMEIHLPSITL